MKERVSRRSRMARISVGKRLELTARDLELLKLLGRYRYLRSNFLYAFLGGASEKRFKERLGHLYHDAGLIDRPTEQWQFANCRYMPAVYELARAGERKLQECGAGGALGRVGRPSRQFAHTLMVCELLASIELASRRVPHLRFIPVEEILAKAPHMRAARNPLELSASGGAKVIPDGLFGLEYGNKMYRFFVLEADRNTMPCVRSDQGQSSVLRKLMAYRAIASEKTYKDRWSVPNLLVLTVTTSEAHQRNLMAAVGGAMQGSATFLFKAASTFGSMLSAASPCAGLLKDPWQRVGYEPMTISA